MKKNKLFLCIILFFSLLSQVQAKHQFIIDTDVGADDKVAMLYLLNKPDIEIKAISIEGDGEAHCQPGLLHVKHILQMTHQETVPVACGRDQPLVGNQHFPDWLRKIADSPYEKNKTVPKNNKSAVDLMIKTLQNASGPIDILAIGPLTNIAEMLAKKPQIKAKIHMIYVMGGAINAPGTIKEVDPTQNNTAAEWNIYIDPVAADRVIRSGVPITLIPLDVTNQVPVDKIFYNKMKINSHTLISRYAYEIYHRNEKDIFNGRWYFWDVLAAVIADNESIAVIQPMKIRVIVQQGSTHGATIIDAERGSSIRVCTGANKNVFKHKLINVLTNT
ncbi:MAG: nucleoside hydrolase [Gammaproteobacteria bacterium]